MKKILGLALIFVIMFGFVGCMEQKSADRTQSERQEQLAREGVAEVGMPAITNFRELKLMKLIYEMRDQSNLTTYTYSYSDMTGKYTFLGTSIGYPIPYSTQMTSPQKIEVYQYYGHNLFVMPQADPNGLFSPSSAAGTYILLVGKDGKPKPFYSEPDLTTWTEPLPDSIVINPQDNP